MNNSDIKCLVIAKGSNRILVIIEDRENKSTSRLPLLSEIKQEITQKYQPQLLSNNLNIVLTDDEISPWDLFEPFPPSNYYDYSYLDLNPEKQESLDNLSVEEQKLIKENINRFIRNS